ncbi:MAG: phosphate ABC transporter permease PstA [Deltaproteobacteria bacterium]|nr:phosphate ABC transporter permease PstA [Deltaproteobacteria bacterium]
MQFNFYTFKKVEEKIALVILSGITFFILFVLGALIYFLFKNGIHVFSVEFFTQFPRAGMTEGGIFPAMVGTCYLTLGAIVVSMPLGILTAIYLEEYARPGWWLNLTYLAINNLAGVPSIVFGLFGLALFVKYFEFQTSILSGALTLACLVLPIIIRASQEAISQVGQELRHGALALGTTRWYMIRTVVLPQAWPGILTGNIISVGRAAGETAAILFTAVAYFYPKLPTSLLEPVMALPYHLYVIATSGLDLDKTRPLAYGTALVLILLVLMINAVATVVRARHHLKMEKI